MTRDPVVRGVDDARRAVSARLFRLRSCGRANVAVTTLACLLALGGILPATPARAASLQVSPIRLDLGADRPAAVMTLHNRGTEPINAQVRVFAWTQNPDEDMLDRTDRVVASPPIVSIAPGGDQTVRILRVSGEALSTEETYRLLVDEIPVDQTSQTTAVRVQLRYSVPVFVGAANGDQKPDLNFSLEPVPAHVGSGNAYVTPPSLALRAVNLDGTHAQISQVKLDWPDGHTSEMAGGLLGYALPHSTRRWIIAQAPSGATTATLHALINGVTVSRSVSLDMLAKQASSEGHAP